MAQVSTISTLTSAIFLTVIFQGKSTLGKVLLRIVGFDSGELLVNDVDVCRYDPTDLHRASSTVFQGFSKYNGSVTDNVGIGYVEDIASPSALKHAIKLAESEHIVDSLPQGIHTRLDALGYDSTIYPPLGQHKMNAERPTWMPHGLSGGQVSNHPAIPILEVVII